MRVLGREAGAGAATVVGKRTSLTLLAGMVVLGGTLAFGQGPKPAPPTDHPLLPALRWAQQALPAVENLKDYCATVTKRECVDGKLGDYEYMFLKIRNKPFSVYATFLGPPARKGQEIIYVEGQNHGCMWAHRNGRMLGTLSVRPDSLIAMHEQRHPLTDVGLVKLVSSRIDVTEHDMQYAESDVKFFPGAKINGRVCTCLQVTHPQPRRYFDCYLSRFYVDDEQGLPVRYESYDWPAERGREPSLIEEYTYLNLKVNNGFTDEDFSIKNPAYHFR